MTLTKEWLLKTISELEEERDAIPGAVNEDAAMGLAAMKLALASLEAEDSFEPVAFINGAWTLVYYRPPKELGLKIGDKLYTAPPAPVVPDEMPDSVYDILCQACGDKAWMYGDTLWNACRAAMLQGAEPVSQRDELPANVIDALEKALQAMSFMGDTLNALDAVCEEDVEYVTPAFEAVRQVLEGNSPAIPDGYALVPVEPTLDMVKAGAAAASSGMLIPGMYRAMLAAAPQRGR